MINQQQATIYAVIKQRLSTATIVYALQTSSLFLLQVFFARTVAGSEFGAFVFYYALIKMLCTPSLSGLNRAVVRFIPLYITEQSWGKLLGLLIFSTLFVLSGGFIIAFAASLLLAHGQLPDLSLKLLIFFVPLFALTYLLRGVLKGLKLVLLSILPMACLHEFMALVSAFGIAHSKIWYSSWNVMLFGVLLLVLVIEAGIISYYLPKVIFKYKPVYAIKCWIATSVPIMISSSIKIFYHMSTVPMVYWLLGAKDAGYYGAALILAKFVAIPIRSMSIAANPYFASYHQDADRHKLPYLVSTTLRLGFRPFGLILLITLLFGKWMLLLFGNGFSLSYLSLCLLIIAKGFGLWTGLATSLLNMTGNAQKPIYPLSIMALLNVALTYILTSKLGINGAALAFLLTQIILAVWFNQISLKRLQINVFKLTFKPAPLSWLGT